MDAITGCILLNVVGGIFLTAFHVFAVETKEDIISVWITGTVVLLVFDSLYMFG